MINIKQKQHDPKVVNCKLQRYRDIETLKKVDH